MKILENYDLENIKPKIAAKMMSELVLNYVHLSEPEFKTEYLGKVTGSDHKRLINAFFESLDMYGLG